MAYHCLDPNAVTLYEELNYGEESLHALFPFFMEMDGEIDTDACTCNWALFIPEFKSREFLLENHIGDPDD